MNIGSRGLDYKVAKTLEFLIPTMARGNVPFHLKFALKVTPYPSPPLKSADFDQYLLNVLTVRASEKGQLSRIVAPTSYRGSAYVTPKSPKEWLKK